MCSAIQIFNFFLRRDSCFIFLQWFVIPGEEATETLLFELFLIKLSLGQNAISLLITTVVDQWAHFHDLDILNSSRANDMTLNDSIEAFLKGF